MKIHLVHKLVFACVVMMSLVACESNPSMTPHGVPAKAELQFMDFQGFDQALARSLSAPLPKVEIAFYDRVTPSALPERLQHWMASVEAGGGTVQVVQPQSTVTARNPLFLISAISAVWSASKMAKEMSISAQFNAAHAYDAQVMLKVDERGDTVVDKVRFLQRKK